MNTVQTLVLLFGMAAVTYLSRRAFLRLPSRYFSPRLRNGLSFIPVGIFAGLIFPSLLVKEGAIVWQPLELSAGVLCLLLMMATKNVFASFGISLAVVVLVTVGVLPFPWK